jgi:hypothetical protein
VTQDELAVLMGWASGVDPYFPAADKDVPDVPAQVATEAVKAHYRTTRETITPADIAWVWREKRRHLPLEEMAPEQRPNPRQSPEQIQAGVDRAIGALAERKALARGEDAETAVAIAEGETAARRSYRDRPCSYCKAQPGLACTDSKGNAMQAAEVAARSHSPGSSRT